MRLIFLSIVRIRVARIPRKGEGPGSFHPTFATGYCVEFDAVGCHPSCLIWQGISLFGQLLYY